jgi:hypothetical protein
MASTPSHLRSILIQNISSEEHFEKSKTCRGSYFYLIYYSYFCPKIILSCDPVPLILLPPSYPTALGLIGPSKKDNI